MHDDGDKDDDDEKDDDDNDDDDDDAHVDDGCNCFPKISQVRQAHIPYGTLLYRWV